MKSELARKTVDLVRQQLRANQDFDVAKSGNTAGERGQYVLTHMLFSMVAVKTLEWLCKTAIM